MKRVHFKKLDAFATRNSNGNPAGCVFLKDQNDLSGPEMLQVAKELKGFVSEVGYITKFNDEEYNFKYYSSERELDFCGHVTIATMYDIAQSETGSARKNYIINTNRGKLKVENRIDAENAVFIMSPEPVYKDNFPNRTIIAEKLKINENEMDSHPISIINAGLNTLIVPIRNLDGILNIAPELEELNNFCVSSGIDIIEVFCTEVYDSSNKYRTRVFAPTFGYIEDPATGSGNSAFGYYLIKNGMWKDGTIYIEQNGEKERYNLVQLQQQHDDKNNIRVWFGGGAITRIEGEYLIN